eukprot:365736-Chlamydomonas_euryale.AAC.11
MVLLTTPSRGLCLLRSSAPQISQGDLSTAWVILPADLASAFCRLRAVRAAVRVGQQGKSWESVTRTCEAAAGIATLPGDNNGRTKTWWLYNGTRKGLLGDSKPQLADDVHAWAPARRCAPRMKTG